MTANLGASLTKSHPKQTPAMLNERMTKNITAVLQKV
jgi:hypothetical protein